LRCFTKTSAKPAFTGNPAFHPGKRAPRYLAHFPKPGQNPGGKPEKTVPPLMRHSFCADITHAPIKPWQPSICPLRDCVPAADDRQAIWLELARTRIKREWENKFDEQ